MRALRPWLLGLGLAGAILGTSRWLEAGVAPGPPPPSVEETAERLEPVPLEVQQIVRERMRRHGDELQDLLRAVVLVDHDQVAALAAKIAEEPVLAPPRPGAEDTLNALLPPRFFALDDARRDEATELAAAARARDETRLGRGFGRLASTCVECHAAFRPPPK